MIFATLVLLYLTDRSVSGITLDFRSGSKQGKMISITHRRIITRQTDEAMSMNQKIDLSVLIGEI